MSRSADDAFRQVSGSVLSLVALADEAVAAARAASGEGWLAAFRHMMKAAVAGAPKAGLPRPSALMGVLEGLVTQHARAATRSAYRAGRPRVQPSPIHPDGLAAAVLNVPAPEIEEFLDVVVGRYLAQLRRGWVGAAAGAWASRGLDPVDDARFAELFGATPFARLLTPTPGGLEADFGALDQLDTFPGIHAAPSRTRFAVQDGRLEALEIRLPSGTFTSADGAAWDLAKYFALQGAALAMVLGVHPTVHFPMDAVNAMTKAVLPKGHVLRRLLEPHLYMQLPLNFAVLYIGRSVAHNDQREIYTPFPGSKDGFFRVTRAYHAGYRYPLAPPAAFGPYGAFLAGYWRVIRRFVGRVVRTVKAGDPRVRRWASCVAEHVPGFPDGDAIFRRDHLAAALTTFICNVSVVHTADHHAYAEIPVTEAPLRLRVPPPTQPGGPPLDRRALVRFEDLFRHRMAREMYFKAIPVRRLVDVEYAFANRALGRAVANFKAELARYDAGLSTRFVNLEGIASSIQF